jgi:type 1 fimbria pilin
MKALAITAALLSSLLAQGPSSPHPPGYTYQGTVQAVQPKAASFDLVIGVGYALRVVHLRTSPGTQFANTGAQSSLGDLKPGDIVRAECQTTATGLVADRIERVGPPASKQEPNQ